MTRKKPFSKPKKIASKKPVKKSAIKKPASKKPSVKKPALKKSGGRSRKPVARIKKVPSLEYQNWFAKETIKKLRLQIKQTKLDNQLLKIVNRYEKIGKKRMKKTLDKLKTDLAGVKETIIKKQKRPKGRYRKVLVEKYVPMPKEPEISLKAPMPVETRKKISRGVKAELSRAQTVAQKAKVDLKTARRLVQKTFVQDLADSANEIRSKFQELPNAQGKFIPLDGGTAVNAKQIRLRMNQAQYWTAVRAIAKATGWSIAKARQVIASKKYNHDWRALAEELELFKQSAAIRQKAKN
jgi:hypothetical protein